MKLHEYQAKNLFVHYGLSTPIGYTCTTPNEAEKASYKIGSGPWVVKCQIHAGGRGKAGGVKIVRNRKEIRAFTEYWFGKRLTTYQTDAKGQPVNHILVEAAADIVKELYLGIVVDCSFRRVVFMASTEGGMDIEKVTQENPHLIYKVTIDPLVGPMPLQGNELAFKLGLEGKLLKQFTKIFMGLAKIFFERDLALIEVNPLVITSQGNLICLDGRLDADENALFRQPDLRKMRDQLQEDPREVWAAKWELNYIALDGNIGCIVNGAGLAMSTMDMIKLHGGNPANFLDVGGFVTKDRVIEAFKIILSDDNVRAVLVNIFGGITRCDLIADGIISALEKVMVHVPVIVRLEGNNADLGAKKLADSKLNLIVVKDLTDAAHLVIAAVKGKY